MQGFGELRHSNGFTVFQRVRKFFAELENFHFKLTNIDERFDAAKIS
jgi:hypothetical protein